MKHIGDRIKALREKRGLSQAAIAFACGTNQALVSKWERGQRDPKVEAVIKLAKALGVSPNQLDPRHEYYQGIFLSGRHERQPKSTLLDGPTDSSAGVSRAPASQVVPGQGAHPCEGKPTWLTEMCRLWARIPEKNQNAVEVSALAAIEKGTLAADPARKVKTG